MISALEAATLSVAAIAGAAALLNLGADRGRPETPMVALVRRRRELNAQLQKLAGGRGEGLARQEAKRMRDSARTDLETAHDEGERP